MFPEDQNYENYHYLIVNLSFLIENTITNDLCFLVKREDNFDRLICLEAQTRWKRSDLSRFGNYLLLCTSNALITFDNFDPACTESYFFVLCTEKNKILNKTYFLYENQKTCPDNLCFLRKLPVKILTRRNGKIPKTKIFTDYLKFCDLFEETTKKFGRTKKSLENLITQCERIDLYPEIFKTRRKEFIDEYMYFLNQEALVEHMQNEIKVKDEALANQKDEIQLKDEALANQRDEIQLKNEALAEKESALVNRDNEIKKLKKENKQLQEKLAKFKDGDNT